MNIIVQQAKYTKAVLNKVYNFRGLFVKNICNNGALVCSYSSIFSFNREVLR